MIVPLLAFRGWRRRSRNAASRPREITGHLPDLLT